GVGAPPDEHPSFLRRSGHTKTNNAQFFVYSSKEMQQFGTQYDLLCIALEDVLEEVIEKCLHHHPDTFDAVEASVDIFLLQETSPVKPFTSFIVNLNVLTIIHKDQGNLKGCIVMVIGDHKGGKLCLFEPCLVLEVKNGDFTVFHSQKISYFNLHYKGVHCSIAIHSDRTGISYQKDSNGWAPSNYVN
ncbi:hypothetical protein BT96DRAFT_839269, partial [Gymnopus androsaceus JB14]